MVVAGLSADSVPPPPPPPPACDLTLEGRSIRLRRRPSSGLPRTGQLPADKLAVGQPHASPLTSLSCLQLRIDLLGEQCADVPVRDSPRPRPRKPHSRRRLEQQRPIAEVVFRPRRQPAPSARARTPLAMSTTQLPAKGQKFAEEAAVQRLLADVEERRKTSTCTSTTTSKSVRQQVRHSDYLHESFDLLHQRHMKNLSDVIGRSEVREARRAEATAPETQPLAELKRQVHIHQSAFYDTEHEHSLTNADNNSNNNSDSSVNNNQCASSATSSSSSDADDERAAIDVTLTPCLSPLPPSTRVRRPKITFSHVSSEMSHLEENIVRFEDSDSSALGSPGRSRSPSPLLEMPQPYEDLSKEIKRPPTPS